MKIDKKQLVKKMCIFALLLSLCYVLPFISMQIPEIGNMLAPMHIPVMIAGFILGPYYSLFLGLIAPITRSLIFGSPFLYPTAICMCFELATYGFVIGMMFKIIKKNKNLILKIYISLITAMIFGRLVWGLSRLVCGLIDANMFTFKLFIAGAFLNAWPGIIIQLILIPALIITLYKTKLLK